MARDYLSGNSARDSIKGWLNFLIFPYTQRRVLTWSPRSICIWARVSNWALRMSTSLTWVTRSNNQSFVFFFESSPQFDLVNPDQAIDVVRCRAPSFLTLLFLPIHSNVGQGLSKTAPALSSSLSSSLALTPNMNNLPPQRAQPRAAPPATSLSAQQPESPTNSPEESRVLDRWRTNCLRLSASWLQIAVPLSMTDLKCYMTQWSDQEVHHTVRKPDG